MLNRGSNIEKGRRISRRVFILAFAKITVFFGISSRLYDLQISDKEKYEILSDKNRIREWKTPPQRGVIIDYFNSVLAENDRVFQLHLALDEVQNFDTTLFRIKNIIASKTQFWPELGLTLDEKSDFDLIKKIILYFKKSKKYFFTCREILNLLRTKKREWVKINSHVTRKGYN